MERRAARWGISVGSSARTVNGFGRNFETFASSSRNVCLRFGRSDRDSEGCHRFRRNSGDDTAGMV
ncbi:hypothetical protein SGPA1_12780 [Streptomyces misionensis JCM 4497]